MKFLSFVSQADNIRSLGILMPDGRVCNISAAQADGIDADLPAIMEQLISSGEPAIAAVRALLQRPEATGYCLDSDQVVYLPPIIPAKNVFCVGRNYREHVIEGNIANGRPADSFPIAIEFFTKAPTTVIGHQATIRRHRTLTQSLDYEVELAIVIGRKGADIKLEEALDYIFGYTIVNDVTARDLQKRHGQWFKGKSLDTTCPMGPVIVHRSAIQDPNSLRLSLTVNGETRQDNNTSDMIFNVQAIVSQLSAGMTLEPGDVICTGTPQGVGFAMTPPRCLETGDVVVADIQDIGSLRNTVVE